MIPIYICEDRPEMLQQLKQIIQNYCMIEDLNFTITLATQKPSFLLEQLKKNITQGIYFLDITFDEDEINGFELGQQIRTLDSRGFLIYVTTHGELLPETFNFYLEALGYILKDNPEQMSKQIHETLLTIQTLLKNERTETINYFTVESAKTIVHVPIGDIQYFETTKKKHTLSLITKNESIEFYGTLNDLEHRFSHQFIRVHQSFLVNKTHIHFVDKKKRIVYLEGGNFCLVARSKLKKLTLHLTE